MSRLSTFLNIFSNLEIAKLFVMLFLACFSHAVLGAPAAAKVEKLPGFEPTKFGVYSGYLHVPGPFEQNS